MKREENAIGLGMRRGAHLVLACLVLFALPSVAAAQPSTPPGVCSNGHIANVTYYCAYEFTLRGSNGYRIRVSAESAGHGPNEIELSARHGREEVDYIAHGTVTSTGVKATFGSLGKLSFRFRPSGRVRWVTLGKKCVKHRPPVVEAQLGTFVGMLRFRGERGYTTVVAHHANGGLGDPLAIKPNPECERPESADEKHQEATAVRLNASRSIPHGGIGFEALAAPLPPSTSPTSRGRGYTFLAFAVERTAGMAVFRTVARPGPTGDFLFDDTLGSATVAPPAPFTGSGTFQRNANGSTTWAGSLAVSIPGLGKVALTGPRFKARLAG